MICWDSTNFPTPSFGRDSRGTNLSISTRTSDNESQLGAETSSSRSYKKEVLSDDISTSPHGMNKQVLQQIAGIKVRTSQTTSNTTSFSLRSIFSTVAGTAGSSFSASSGGAPEPSSLQGHNLPLPNLRIFTVAELRAATKNFRSDLLVGKGGFGRVYKGWIEEKSPNKNSGRSGRRGGRLVIAIKKLNSESEQGLQEWRAEVDFLGRLSHPNLVRLLGYGSEDEALLLVYEYMQKGSLEHHLFGKKVQPLPWDTRLKILIGAARGLAFLHTSDTQVIYRDFKSSNILLDPFYNAKISDFGLAIMGPTESKSFVTTSIMGTYGYAAPEYVANGHLYVKSDVYAFGVVLLEMLTGLPTLDNQRRPSGQESLVNWIIPYLHNKRKLKGIMDSKLKGKYPLATAYQISQLAVKCLASEPKNRPSMEEVLKVLENVDVSNVERHAKPKVWSTHPGGKGPRRVQLPTPPQSPLTPPRPPLTPP